MDNFDLNLLRSQSQVTMSSSDLQELGKKAADAYLHTGAPLNDTIVKMASERPGITVDHVQRIIEFANNETFRVLFEKQAGHKNVDFDIADPREILRTLDIQARPAVVVSTPDYSADPEKIGQNELAEDVELCRMFGRTNITKEAAAKIKIGGAAADEVRGEIEKVASVDALKEELQYPEANPFGELIRTSQRLEKLADDAKDALRKNYDMQKEATDKFFYEVKQYLLSGGNFGEMVHALSSVDDEERVKTAVAMITPSLVKHGFDPVKARAEMIAYQMEKGASTRSPNPGNPILESFSAMVQLSDGGVKLAKALENLTEDQKRVRSAMVRASKAVRVAS